MGAWGVGSFENDHASDFLAEVMEGADLSLVREALDNVLTSTEYVEAPDACQGIVAAEIIAAARGRPTLAALRMGDLSQWLGRVRPTVDGALVADAGEAMSRILAENSELRELWEDSDDFTEWQAAVAELRMQLQV